MPNKSIIAILVALLIPIPVYAQDLDLQLVEAAERGQTERVKSLLDSGAKVNAKDKVGATSLMWAAGFGHTETVQLLLKTGAKVNAKTKDGMTPLMSSAFLGHTATVKILLDAGADVNAKDKRGETALLKAASMDHTEIVQVLRAKGASLYAETKDGMTPIHVMASLGAARKLLDEGMPHTEFVEMVKEFGLKEVPIINATKPFQFEAFSILPPRGKNWTVGTQGINSIALTKKTAEGGYRTIIAFAQSDDARFGSWANLLVLAKEGALTEQHLKQIKEQQWGASRYTPLEVKLTLDRL